tara:strand:+ start:555 stop:845 length:291 start_codon:yes stop_codon:yes gene_type:complete
MAQINAKETMDEVVQEIRRIKDVLADQWISTLTVFWKMQDKIRKQAAERFFFHQCDKTFNSPRSRIEILTRKIQGPESHIPLPDWRIRPSTFSGLP